MNAKYPKTPHLPWSPNCRQDDKRLKNVKHLLEHEIIFTEKMDGTNLCMTNKVLYARSHEAVPRHWTFDYAKATHGWIKHKIPGNVSVFCEYLYAVHSVEYDKLPDYLMVFAVRDDLTGQWASWPGVVMWAQKLGLPTVPVLSHHGAFEDEVGLRTVSELHGRLPSDHTKDNIPPEGCVARLTREVKSDADFKKTLAKWVRKNHVQPGAEHWMHKHIKINKLAPKK